MTKTPERKVQPKDTAAKSAKPKPKKAAARTTKAKLRSTRETKVGSWR